MSNSGHELFRGDMDMLEEDYILMPRQVLKPVYLLHTHTLRCNDQMGRI
jgi:hypothetical protein